MATSPIPDLPPLPEPEATIRDFGDVYQASHMQAYGLQCYRLAMERAAKLVQDYDTCGDHTQGWQDTFAERIRALALQENKGANHE